ncbi:Uncharacterised protein g8764 [Pycnogonum litorale]
MPGPALKGTVSVCGSGPTESSKPRNLYRVTLMGAARVGKTAIINQFLHERFISNYKPTVEELHKVEYEIKSCPLTLEILDTSGAYEFPAMRQLSIATSDGFILVFAVDNPESFEEVRAIRNQILENKKVDAPIVVVCNKSDLQQENRILKRELIETVVSIDWEHAYIECSAKTNLNIISIFTELFLQANIDYSLSSAVEKRRKSLPAYTSLPKLKVKASHKRNSCVMQ